MQQTPESGVKRSLYIHILAGFLMLGGCSQTVYTGYENSKDAAPLLLRVVKFETQDAFFREPPTCITVLPVLYSGDRQFKFLVEEAVARHLSVKAKRIIGPLERQKMERRLALDLDRRSSRFGWLRPLKPTVLRWMNGSKSLPRPGLSISYHQSTEMYCVLLLQNWSTGMMRLREK